MVIALWVIIIMLVIAIVVLSIALLVIIKKATYLSEKDKEIIEFAIDMYIDYAKELDIIDPDQHDLVIKQLKKIKEKINDNGKKS